MSAPTFPGVRTPTRTLKVYEIILRLEACMEGGGPDSEVLLPAADWDDLVTAAQAEAEASLDAVSPEDLQ